MFWLEWILAQHTRGHALYTLKTSTESSVDCTVGQYILLGTRHDLVSTTLWIAKSEIKENYEKLLLEFLAGSRLLPFSITAQAF